MDVLNFEIGQKLFYVHALYSNFWPEYVTVTKVGRTWITLSNCVRFPKQDLPARCEDGRGLVYASENDFAAVREKQQLWSELRRRIDRASECPKWLTADRIREIAAMLEKPKEEAS
jgi:hypothetical protein